MRRLIYSAAALAELDEIWLWNARQFGEDWANGYMSFLRDQIRSIPESLDHDKVLQNTSGYQGELRARLIRRSKRGHGHVVIYQVSLLTVDILHIFHTAQDWPGRI